MWKTFDEIMDTVINSIGKADILTNDSGFISVFVNEASFTGTIIVPVNG